MSDEDEAIQPWRVGKIFGLSTAKDGGAIEAIMEERKEWKKGKGKKTRRKGLKQKKVSTCVSIHSPWN